MSIVLFDNTDRKHLYPLNNACAVADLRLGICTFKERWKLLLKQPVYVHTEDYLRLLYDAIPSEAHWWIDSSVLPHTKLADRILSLNENEALADSKGLIAGKKNFDAGNFPKEDPLSNFETVHE